MPALKHIHTYIRSRTNKNVYRCAHPDCSHYDKIDNLRGKKALCRCGREFVLEEIIRIHFRCAEPRCDFCRGKAIENPAAESIMESILNETPALETILKETVLPSVQKPLIDPQEDEGAFEFESDEESFVEHDD